jgi:hypothetical protein
LRGAVFKRFLLCRTQVHALAVFAETFINSPTLLDGRMKTKSTTSAPAGSPAIEATPPWGCFRRPIAIAQAHGIDLPPVPNTTAWARLSHIWRRGCENLQPMNVNFGHFPARRYRHQGGRGRKERYKPEPREETGPLGWPRAETVPLITPVAHRPAARARAYALFAHDVTQAAGGTFLLRIEDIDQSAPARNGMWICDVQWPYGITRR